ncbi:MAG: radical SAM protein [Candidatus Lernaella stagnicola]|nr:radical SAM protein [Candidatus Lernaella stagnicola]
MRLALVFNSFSYKLHEENLRVVQRFFGMFPPLSLAWVAAIAEQHGHQATIIDARTLQLSPDDVVDRLREWKPDLVGFMMTTYMFRETLQWARHIKQALGVPIVVGGYNLRVYPKESLMNDVVDFGCVNSALVTVPRLLEEFEGARRFDDVPGLVFKRNNGEIVQTPSAAEEEKFTDYPFPWRSGLPNDLYEEFPTERKNFTVMVTSKGCPMSCTFCEAGGTSYNPRTVTQVVDEMEICYYQYGVREIDIFDYEFAINRKRTAAICDEIIRRKLDITWACRSRIDSVNEELLRKMKQAGCRRIYFGIESGLQSVLDAINKKITIGQIRDTVALTQEKGIRTLGFFLVGVPGETKQTFAETVKFAKSLGLDYVQFSKLTAKPLTSMWRDMAAAGNDYWRDYVLGLVEERALDRPWTQLSNEEIDEITKRAYIHFHSRPSFLLKHTLRVRSFAEFKRKFVGFLEMMLKQEDHSEDWLAKKRRFEAYHSG